MILIIITVPGKPYPVQILHTKAPEANYVSAAIATVMQIHISQNAGDILVFLTVNIITLHVPFALVLKKYYYYLLFTDIYIYSFRVKKK